MLVEYYGLWFDTDTKEVLAGDGLEVLSVGEFRVFPLIPTAQGLSVFKRIASKAMVPGLYFTTKVGKDNGQPALLVTVFNDTTTFIEDYPFGRTLETLVRHRSEQAAVNQLKDVLRQQSVERNN